MDINKEPFFIWLFRFTVSATIIAIGVFMLVRTQCLELSCKYSIARQSVGTLHTNMKGRGYTGTATYIAPHYLLTAYHVISKDTDKKVHIILDGGVYQGTVIAELKNFDMAIVYTPLHVGIPVKLGSSSEAYVGDTVITVGSPVELDYTLGVGHITAPERIDYDRKRRVLQYFAPNYHGNSGGGLFNSSGELIGVISYYDTFPFFSFAISIEQATFQIEHARRKHKEALVNGN